MERELVDTLAQFGRSLHKEIKGLAARIDWRLYGIDTDYLVPIGDDTKPVSEIRKERADFETFVLIEGAGSLQGHITGNPDRKPGGGWSGRLEEKKDMQYIHQLLPLNLSNLRSRCRLKYPVLAERSEIMITEPHCASAILFFQAFLKSIYRGSTGADTEILMRHLRTFPSEGDPSEIYAKWNELEKRLKAEKRGSIYEVKEGHFHVFEKLGKERRLINGWLFGLDEAPDKDDAKGEQESHYELQIEGASFNARMKFLMQESQRLLGEKNYELVALVADHKSGALAKLVKSIDSLMHMDEIRGMEPQQKMAFKTLADRVETLASLAARKPRLIEPFGIDTDGLARAAVTAMNLKKKLRA